jgi:hypothetical protein
MTDGREEGDAIERSIGRSASSSPSPSACDDDDGWLDGEKELFSGGTFS